MSTADADVTVPDTPGPDGRPGELTTGRVARVGDIEVRRLLPLRHRRSVGAWCFVDHYGPMSVDGVAGMQVPAAPAHRPADRHLAAGRERAAPGQPGQRADDPARPAQPDDRRTGDRPLRGITARARPAAARRPALAGPARGTAAGGAGLRASRRAARGRPGRVRDHRVRRVAGRGTVPGHRLLPGGGGPAAGGPRHPRPARPGARLRARAVHGGRDGRGQRGPRSPRGACCTFLPGGIR